MKTRKFLLAATAAMTALLFGLTSCEDKGGNGGLTLSPNYVTVAPGETETVTLNSDGVAVDAASVTWTSNNTDIFTIENGVITGVKVGHGTFTATYNNQSVTGDVEVEEEAPEVPVIEPVAGGITIAVYIPEGSDCIGAPLWAGSDTDWGNGATPMTAVEGAPGWYTRDFADGTVNGKPNAQFEGYEDGLGNWETQWGEKEILPESTISTTEDKDGNLVANGTGIIYIWVKSWRKNPCEPDREYKFTIVLPECTPEGTETVYVCGSFPDADGNTWAKGTGFPVVDNKAEVTIVGQANTSFKARLSADDWSMVEKTMDNDNGCVAEVNDRKLGDWENKELQVEGWDGDGILSSCFGEYDKCPEQ